MVERLSTGLRDWLLEMGSMREAFKDARLKIYSGPAPDSADDEISGNLLVTITKASGTASTRSQPNTWKIRIAKTGSTGTNAPRVNLKFCPAGVATGATGADYAYTSGSDPTGKTWDNTTIGLTRVLGDIQYPINVVHGGTGAGETGNIFVACDIPGDEIVLIGNTGTPAVVVTQVQDESRGNFLWFNEATAGAIPKTSDVWSGLIALTGVAGYARLVQNDDDGTDSDTQIRLQLGVSTSGTEINLSTTSLVAATTLTLDTFSITLPAE